MLTLLLLTIGLITAGHDATLWPALEQQAYLADLAEADQD
jgi:hypothetical protein